jgi:hypothetical protein
MEGAGMTLCVYGFYELVIILELLVSLCVIEVIFLEELGESLAEELVFLIEGIAVGDDLILDVMRQAGIRYVIDIILILYDGLLSGGAILCLGIILGVGVLYDLLIHEVEATVTACELVESESLTL